jgi:2-keto-3-deoxy-L-rhamnonate aldolase RhmA
MRVASRRIRSKLESGGRAYGSTIQFPYPEIVETVGYTGYDYVWIDAEHGTMDLSQIAQLIRAAEATGLDSIVRVPDHTVSFIGRVLDAGATGIMAPHVRSAEIAEQVVAATKFAPLGVRGACPSVRSAGHLATDWPAEFRKANEDTLVFGLIEDIEGVEDIERIVHVPGLDGVVFGPFDLSMAMGLEGAIDHPDVVVMHDRVVAAARGAGIEYVAIAGWEPGGTHGIVESGSRIINAMGDRGSLLLAHRQALEKIVAELG